MSNVISVKRFPLMTGKGFKSIRYLKLIKTDNNEGLKEKVTLLKKIVLKLLSKSGVLGF